MSKALRDKFEEQAHQQGLVLTPEKDNEERYYNVHTQRAWELVQACQPEAAFLIESYGNSPRTGYTFDVTEVFLGTMTAARRHAKGKEDKSKRFTYSARKIPVVR